MKRIRIIAAAACAIGSAPHLALACATCGCTLNSDWASQGFNGSTGFSLDLRQDFYDQNDLRTGTGRVDRSSIVFPTDREIQQKTINRTTTLSLDYGIDADWGVSAQLPYVDRFHTTVVDGDTGVSQSRSRGIGDVRVLGRYQGFSAARDWGVQLGAKLPTGRTDVVFDGGPQAGELLDRGLQAGTGSTDLLVGLYRFGTVASNVDYFGQALVQVPVASKNGFKPGISGNLTAGVRYVNSDSRFVPQLQINAHTERRETGAEADTPNSGATLVYLSPGVTATLSDSVKAYAFVQVPLYQRVNGYQLEPKYSVSVGLHYAY